MLDDIDYDSYVVRERARHIQDNNKKFTWESLEKMNINELKGITQVNFDPATLIGNEDEEDRLYMQEYMKVSKSNRNPTKQIHDRRRLEDYGDLNRSQTSVRDPQYAEAYSLKTAASPAKRSPMAKHSDVNSNYR